jgi:hypothetical protein
MIDGVFRNGLNKIIEQIEMLKNRGIKEVFSGEIDFIDRKFVESLAKRIKKEK